MHPLCTAEGIFLPAWSPLARGRLTPSGETTTRLVSDQFGKNCTKLKASTPLSRRARRQQPRRERGVSRAQIALASLLNKPAVSAPISALHSEQLDDAMPRSTELVAARGRSELTLTPHRGYGTDREAARNGAPV
ncbi:aldo/keto reductase [Serratia ureilytica]